MKKLSKISESAWGELRRRSSGNIIRKEDEVLLGFGVSEMYDYLKSEYKDTNKVHWMDGDRTECIESGSIGIDPVKGISLYFDYVKDTLVEIVIFYTITSFSKDPKEYPEFFKKLSDTFDVSVYKDKPEYSKQWTIKPKSGKLTNKTIIEVLDFFLNNEITESAWGEMRHRSSGKIIRKEDDINNLDRDGLYNLIFDLYEQVDEHFTPLKGQVSQSRTYFHIPIFKNHHIYPIDVVFVDNKISEIKLMTYMVCIENFKHPLTDKFSITKNPDDSLKITSKDGEVSNQICMDLIKTIVEDAPEPYLKKRGE